MKVSHFLDSLKGDKVFKFKLYEEVKIYQKPDYQGSQGS